MGMKIGEENKFYDDDLQEFSLSKSMILLEIVSPSSDGQILFSSASGNDKPRKAYSIYIWFCQKSFKGVRRAGEFHKKKIIYFQRSLLLQKLFDVVHL